MGHAHALTAFFAATFLGAVFLAAFLARLGADFLAVLALGARLGAAFLATLGAAVFAINERTRLGFDW